MKDDTLIIAAVLLGGGYLAYKKLQETGEAITNAPAAAVQSVFESVSNTEKYIYDTTTRTINDTINNTAKTINDTIQAVGNIPRNLAPPVPQYIQDAVTQEYKNKNLTTDFKPKVVVIDSKNPSPLQDLTIALNTQKTGYLAPINFDQPLQISTILQRTPAVYTGGSIAPKVVDIQKTYEYAGVPYATYAQQTGQNLTAAQLSSLNGIKIVAGSNAPTSASAPTKNSELVGNSKSTASVTSDAHYEPNLKVWVDNKTAKIVGKKAVGVWK